MQFAIRHTGYDFLSCIKPALVYLEVAMGKASSFTPTVNLLLKGAKQPARNHRGPAKKAPALSPLQLASVSAKIYPPDDHVGLACPVCLRTAFLCSFHISHAVPLILFCQASSKAFRARWHFVYFPFIKERPNAQRPAVLPRSNGLPLCTVRVMKLYFCRFGLRMGANQNDESFISFRLWHQSARILPIQIPSSALPKQLQTGETCSLFAAIQLPRWRKRSRKWQASRQLSKPVSIHM